MRFSDLRPLNLVLALTVEAAALAAIAFGAFRMAQDEVVEAGGTDMILIPALAASVATVAFIGIWAIWASPRAPKRLPRGDLVWLKARLFALGVAALAVGGLTPAAVALGTASAIHLGLAWVWNQV